MSSPVVSMTDTSLARRLSMSARARRSASCRVVVPFRQLNDKFHGLPGQRDVFDGAQDRFVHALAVLIPKSTITLANGKVEYNVAMGDAMFVRKWAKRK
jgi:hypothetical protein